MGVDLHDSYLYLRGVGDVYAMAGNVLDLQEGVALLHVDLALYDMLEEAATGLE
jgi:hypothetical protein